MPQNCIDQFLGLVEPLDPNTSGTTFGQFAAGDVFVSQGGEHAALKDIESRQMQQRQTASCCMGG